MIVLSTTTDQIRIVLDATPTTELDCVASWRDITTGLVYTAGRSVGHSSGTTAAAVVDSPAASTQRVIDMVSAYNPGSSTVEAIVSQFVGGTSYTLWSGELAPGESVTYHEGVGWTRNEGLATETESLTLLATTDPVADPNTGKIYVKDIAGRIVPKFIGPSGVDYPLQPHIGLNNVRAWCGGATTTATTFASTIGSLPYTGASPTAPTIPAVASTSLRNQTYRSTISTSTTGGTIAYIRGNYLPLWRGSSAGMGGFFVAHRFALTTLQTGMRVFVGLVDAAANPTNVDPTTTTTPGGFGMAIAASTGNWQFVHNITGTARTAIDLGTDFTVNNADLLELILFCKPNDSGIHYRCKNLSTNTESSGNITTNIPANTTFLTPSVWITNNATAAAAAMDFVSTYVETDY